MNNRQLRQRDEGVFDVFLYVSPATSCAEGQKVIDDLVETLDDNNLSVDGWSCTIETKTVPSYTGGIWTITCTKATDAVVTYMPLLQD